MINTYCGIDGISPAELETLKAIAKRSGYPPSKVLKSPVQVLKVKAEGVLLGFQVLAGRGAQWVAEGEYVAELCWATAATEELPVSWRKVLDHAAEAQRVEVTPAA